MSWDVASVFYIILSSWCHLFCEVHQFLLQKSHSHNMMYPPPYLTVGMVALSLSFPPNATTVIMTKQFSFSFIRPHDIQFSSVQKYFINPWRETVQTLLCPCVHLQTAIFLFYVAFGATYSSSSSDLSAHVSTGLVSLWIMTHNDVLVLIRAFLKKGHRIRLFPERYDGWTSPWCLYFVRV